MLFFRPAVVLTEDELAYERNTELSASIEAARKSTAEPPSATAAHTVSTEFPLEGKLQRGWYQIKDLVPASRGETPITDDRRNVRSTPG